MKSWIDFRRKNCDVRELKEMGQSLGRMANDFLNEIDLLERFDDEEIQQYCERMKKARQYH